MDGRVVDKIFQAVDEDNSGSISFDEFAKIAKIELELLALSEVVESDGALTDETKKAVAALKDGVRVNRTMSTMYDLRMQGDVTMLSQAAVEARQALKEDPGLRKLVSGPQLRYICLTCQTPGG